MGDLPGQVLDGGHAPMAWSAVLLETVCLAGIYAMQAVHAWSCKQSLP